MSSKIVVYGALAALISVAASTLIAGKLLPASLDMQHAPAHATETMKAIVYREHGDISALEYTPNFPKPVPILPAQYLIKVEASALNPVDFKLRRSLDIPQLLVPLPKIPGADLAGVVVEAPTTKEGNKFQVGDRVAALVPLMGTPWGTHAEFVAVEERFLAKIGDNTSFVEAASYPLVGLTVLQNFANLHATPQPGEKLLVHAGAGGVGSFAVQYGKHELKLHVATTASAPKAKLLKQLGADIVVDYRTQPFEKVLKDYDIVLDSMSWLYEERTLTSGVLKSTGHYLNVPSSDWGLVDGVEKANGPATLVNAVVSKWKNWIDPGSTPKYGLVFVQPNGEDLQRVLDLIETGEIRAVIDRTYHLSEAAEAYRYLEQGHATGKVVLYHGEKKPEEQLKEEGTHVDEGAEEQVVEAESEQYAPEEDSRKRDEHVESEEATA